jgi:putative aldouronate transport system substrate-binding protein
MYKIIEQRSLTMFEPLSRRRFLAGGGKTILAAGAFSGVAGTLLSACGSSSPTTSDVVEVSYTYPTFTPVPDAPLVQDALNKILKPRYNLTIKLKPIDAGAYDQKQKLAVAAGDVQDIVYAVPWTNNYYVNVAQGALKPLDDLLQKYAPKTFASMAASAWNATRVGGKIYGVLNQQPWTRPIGPRVRKDLADKYSLDLNAITTFDDLTPFLAAVKAGEPGVTPIGIGQITDKGGPYSSVYLGYEIVDGVSTDAGIIGVKATDPNLRVVNIATLPEFFHQAQLARKWYQAGYYPADLPGDQVTANWRAGKYAVEIDVVHRDSVGQLKQAYGYDFVAKGLGPLILTTSGITATMNNISSTSKHPEAAMKLLEAFNNDLDVYHLICRGIKGKHYVVSDPKNNVIDFPNGVTASNNRYNPQSSWMFGNIFNDYYPSKDVVGAWPLSLKDNQSATPSQALGFAFDPTNVKTELAQVQQVQQQYGYPLIMGRVDTNTGLQTYLSKLKDAGVDKVMTEIQSQLDKWKSSKS